MVMARAMVMAMEMGTQKDMERALNKSASRLNKKHAEMCLLLPLCGPKLMLPTLNPLRLVSTSQSACQESPVTTLLRKSASLCPRLRRCLILLMFVRLSSVALLARMLNSLFPSRYVLKWSMDFLMTSMRSPSMKRSPSMRKSPNMKNLSMRSLNMRSPSMRNPSMRSPSMRNPSMRNPSMRNPSMRSPKMKSLLELKNQPTKTKYEEPKYEEPKYEEPQYEKPARTEEP